MFWSNVSLEWSTALMNVCILCTAPRTAVCNGCVCGAVLYMLESTFQTHTCQTNCKLESSHFVKLHLCVYMVMTICFTSGWLGYHTCTSGGELSAALLAGDAPSPPLRAAQRGRGRPRGSVWHHAVQGGHQRAHLIPSAKLSRKVDMTRDDCYWQFDVLCVLWWWKCRYHALVPIHATRPWPDQLYSVTPPIKSAVKVACTITVPCVSE